ncbi:MULTISPECIES: 2-dehydro-3-deoxygalactonokinase [unclassified Symbiopectobacterium]|uniref:2-dehydro-3-deoxygalactonokinase n=1 Tax=unclassified Symbiopectobacterium TaxID=2794573 RepID=UPI002227D4A6|nr:MULTISPECIES: 2-dehydro-3-deoxygalactonokinase [unclassified Symbiopectobacterium]MCW2475096.1 2-dehydro-3-deoxygalactonokinase [Candidatus Symbiopectobacterium sp. NZEC151]MCW2486728.1 2-dehydro-3-deoxygalactonokinase [Candidatus Symbiopectobacterium sp. NZEC127]
MYSVTIDTGTTNTRVFVWQDNRIIAEASQAVGVRDTAITGSKETLTRGVQAAVQAALAQAALPPDAKVTYLSAGMITSNVGLCEIPHVVAPAGINELAAGMVQQVIPEVSDQPIWFVPGIRNNDGAVAPENVEKMDVMRGEEVETIGAIAALDIRGPALIIQPGSHSKFIKVDADNRIEGCVTTIAGELLDVITQRTILASSLKHQFANEVEAQYLLQGAHDCAAVGLARSCFSVRILDMFASLSDNQKANYLLGAVLQTDILAIKNSKALNISPDATLVICGKKILKNAFEILIKDDAFFTGDVVVIDDNQPSLSGLGALEIARVRKII